MGISARVESLDALRWLKVAMAKFAADALAALGDADAELQRTVTWLETEQLAHWQALQRTRMEAVSQARDALRAKTMFKGIGGRTPSTVDEKKAVALALRARRKRNRRSRRSRSGSRT